MKKIYIPAALLLLWLAAAVILPYSHGTGAISTKADSAHAEKGMKYVQ